MKRPVRSILVSLASICSILGPAAAAAPDDAATTQHPPNIVFVLIDDFSTELMGYLDGMQAMAENGVSFSTYVSSASLCCPSRASILTGKYPHNTGVLNNVWPGGGFGAYLQHGLEQEGIGTSLDAAGYRTGFMGKFLNGYKTQGGTGADGSPAYPANYVPPGWDEWYANGAAYQNFSYSMVAGADGYVGTEVVGGHGESNYLTDVLADRATEFIARNAAEPFFLMINPFATHANVGDKQDPEGRGGPSFPPAPRDRAESPTRPAGWAPPEFPLGGDCGGPGGGCDLVSYPDPSWGTSFNQPPSDPPRWYGPRPQPLGPAKLAVLAGLHLERVQMSQSIDDLLVTVNAAIAAAGVAGETYVFVASDNGHHLGQHALPKGKSTAYDSDVVTPLVVLPPRGAIAPTVSSEIVQNIDFLPTFLELAHRDVPASADGRSFAHAIGGDVPAQGLRRAALVEFNGTSDKSSFDPDRESSAQLPPKYFALRAADYLYVDYTPLDGTLPGPRMAEYYDLRTDPDQMVNIVSGLPAEERRALNKELRRLAECAGTSCRTAPGPTPSPA